MFFARPEPILRERQIFIAFNGWLLLNRSYKEVVVFYLAL
jgi:hypothetical protein